MMPYKLREARPMQANLLLLCTLRKASDAGRSRQLGHPYRGQRVCTALYVVHTWAGDPFIVRPPVADQALQLALSVGCTQETRTRRATLLAADRHPRSVGYRCRQSGHRGQIAATCMPAYLESRSTGRRSGRLSPRAGYPQQSSQTSGSIRTL
ncbi:hypothetical protein LY76DRAFT_414845 [Colletotrichum caudatum]|nr:hypothetical protein LY76DRAFT_414845 [Colletotrichum caudatum]